MKSNTIIALALCTAALAIPPDNFGFPTSEDDAQLSVTYQASTVQPGILFGIDVPASQPDIAVNETYAGLNNDYTGQYLLFMVDPDASYPENPQNRFIIHWWQEGLTKSTTEVDSASIGGTRLVNDTAPRVSYRRPRPPTNSSAHRYIQYLFEQPSNFQVPEAYSGYNDQNITRFPFEQFLNDAGLEAPVAANYFYCSNQTAVPATFVAAPGEEYPGGNGAMITQGTNEPTPTGGSSSASSTSTATGAASPATYTGAASTFSSDTTLTSVLLAMGAFLALR
ncbi:hypothetical protein LTR70_005632 [Exophiala xenobiotica]|uniref:PEBP-like protein n=1 Tax=Lithohypha guttulata TaxID=1690604 RepID=A0ABR0JZS9_9EURO|nr:hypothetical protein LTR24_008835 [Lithohypha guttulata]KAK5317952.1 hypothetical protein LTR70_005632 [Exophiala xenobiotica]